tara:strand:+ start:2258 stop:2374 length:117 start_codon:yes stop_codon:yes gene_type:complete
MFTMIRPNWISKNKMAERMLWIKSAVFEALAKCEYSYD